MYLTELIFHTEKTVNDMKAFYGILIPFLGTSLGAACVFFMKKSLSDAVQRSLTGFAAGVMVATSSRTCTPRAGRSRGRGANSSARR